MTAAYYDLLTYKVLDMEARLPLHLDECGGVALCADAPVLCPCIYSATHT